MYTESVDSLIVSRKSVDETITEKAVNIQSIAVREQNAKRIWQNV